MKYFLLKNDPETYSIADLERERKTVWDGVHNFQAINFIKSMEVGDMAFVYHSQKEKAILGLARVIGEPFENKKDPRKSWATQIEFVKIFDKPITLSDIKTNPICKDFLLVRNPRLSVMEVPEEIVKFIQSFT